MFSRGRLLAGSRAAQPYPIRRRMSSPRRGAAPRQPWPRNLAAVVYDRSRAVMCAQRSGGMARCRDACLRTCDGPTIAGGTGGGGQRQCGGCCRGQVKDTSSPHLRRELCRGDPPVAPTACPARHERPRRAQEDEARWDRVGRSTPPQSPVFCSSYCAAFSK
jgi:hypothetical protein